MAFNGFKGFNREGEKFGCSDGGPPENCTPYQLSRMHDALVLIQENIGHVAALDAYRAMPDKAKMDYNWSKWAYVEKR